jgi:hypothetical protein
MLAAEHQPAIECRINTYDLAFRKQCNLMEGGNPLYCDQLLPNPFVGLAPFVGTSLYSNATISRATLANPFPAFGGLTEQMRNDGKVWYNSLQVTYEVRMRGDWNVLANYTLRSRSIRTATSTTTRIGSCSGASRSMTARTTSRLPASTICRSAKARNFWATPTVS